MNFAVIPEEPVNVRVARVAREAASAGPMGAWLQGDRYQDFLSVWGQEDRLRFVRTSCAVCASAVLGYCGHRLNTPWHADGSWGITSWLGLDFSHHAWTRPEDCQPQIGDVFYRGDPRDTNGHVGIFVERLPDGFWRTCEGGGSLGVLELSGLSLSQVRATTGTVYRMTPAEGKDVFAPDWLGRHLTGWWDVSRIGLPTYEQIIELDRNANA